MATPSTATAGRIARHDDFRSTPLLHRSQQGSPTLTNPDMILPDYDEAEHLDDVSHSPSAMWDDAQPHDAFHDFSSAVSGYLSGSLAQSTPIIYGNGTMLSDIGEVTEVESTVGCEPSRNSSRQSGTHSGTGGSDTPLRSPPIMGWKTLKKRPQITNRQRRLSIESTSTIQTIEVPDDTFGDFDDSISEDDSSFHGDDEESIAGEFLDEKSAHVPVITTKAPSFDRVLDENSLDSSSTTLSISKRAEQILANAKQRLTAMEGNLNRARTFSYSSVSDASPPSGTVARSNVLPKGRMKSTNLSHSRNVSENGLQGVLRINMLPQRSASALGAAGGYRQQLPLSKSADTLGVKSSLGSLRSPLSSIDSTLEPLDEDEDAEGEVQTRSYARLRGPASPSLGTSADAAMTRSASAAQVRDLQSQMQGLKGKISSLRDQAKQDSMKRRSMQSLRAQTPFTNASHEPAITSSKATPSRESGSRASSHAISNGTKSPSETDNERSGIWGEGQEQQSHVESGEKAALNADQFQGARDIQPPVLKVDSQLSNGESQQEPPQPNGNRLPHVKVMSSGSHTDDNKSQDVSEDALSESGESLYHDTHQEPGDISHEDREDAFDYEHIFLHSAMGTLSRQGMARTDSFSSNGSEDSVETARGPAMTYVRRPSLDTMTSIESFATAREHGVESRSSTAQSSRLDDGFVTPAVQYEDQDDSPSANKRSTFGSFPHLKGSVGGSIGIGGGSDSRAYYRNHTRHSSLIQRHVCCGTETSLHRPSFSSFESTGTNRSFPLVNRARLSGGVLTPSGSPDYKLKQVSESLMNETASIRDKDSVGSGPNSPAIQTLSREDQLLVEQVVASLGRCVLGLSESARQGTGDVDHYRRRIEAAKKLLENVSD
ncbi:hypothetical protein E4U42_005883 [Claviceps africana]|uniref:Uncharacterized protein n=1 Tax=Claviceps africana TaxID=83212 RepID=A0A8K0NH47_9HYPO|nr:hypothetical protein E4U42_005883 [Claviceps africana]